jgi:tryptophan synthase beta chain
MEDGFVEARAYHQNVVFEAAQSFARAEGFIVAPETAHALRAVYDEALRCKESGDSKVILFNNSGHGHFDLAAYDAYQLKELPDFELEDAKIQSALDELPQVSE